MLGILYERFGDLLHLVSVGNDGVQIHLIIYAYHATSVRDERDSNSCRGNNSENWYLVKANLCKYNAPSPLTAMIYDRKRWET